MVGSSAWQWTGGGGGHGGSGKERKDGDGMEGTRDKLQVEKYVVLLQCVWAHKVASKQACMLMWEADWETCLRHCWGQQDFGRSSAFVGGGVEMGRRQSKGWRSRRRRKREGFCCGTSATAVWRWQGHVRLIGCVFWWRLTLRARCLSLTTWQTPAGHVPMPCPHGHSQQEAATHEHAVVLRGQFVHIMKRPLSSSIYEKHSVI